MANNSEIQGNIFAQKGLSAKLVQVPGSEFKRKASRPAKSVLVNTKLPGLRSWQEALREFLISNF